MLIGFLIVLGVILVVALNIESAKTVNSSEIHSDAEKRKYLFIIWGVPILGTMIAMWLINKDIRKKTHEIEDEIAPAIKELGDRLKRLESGIQQKREDEKRH